MQIVRETRKHHGLMLGASPRASVVLMSAAKAFAALQARDFVTPEDVRNVAVSVLQHRVILTPEKEMEGLKPARIIEQILDNIEVPR